MQRISDGLVFSPTDLNHFLECEYLTCLDIEVANGRNVEQRRRPEAAFLAAKGEDHERLQLAQFEREGRKIVRIADAGGATVWVEAAQATHRAMLAGADIIYQGVLVCNDWRGKADFLVR